MPKNRRFSKPLRKSLTVEDMNLKTNKKLFLREIEKLRKQKQEIEKINFLPVSRLCGLL